ncbi:MAG: hypothetical protein JWM38_968 [Sphingomonas bacterium]|nr:hypothetical protein [Sphingomonas bacterium]MDB5717541.1 hypothetical protein [Sphingomonas bacterium]
MELPPPPILKVTQMRGTAPVKVGGSVNYEGTTYIIVEVENGDEAGPWTPVTLTLEQF